MTWPTEDEAALATEVARLLERTASREDLKAAVQPTDIRHDVAWKQLATQLGAAGLAVDEDRGGAGADVGALAAVAEQIGKACSAVPFLSTAIATTALTAVGDTEVLPVVASGERSAVLAAPLDGSPVTVTAVGGTLTGSVDVVDALTADVLVVVAKAAGGVALFVVEASTVRRTPLHTLDLGRPQARVEFDGTRARELAADAKPALSAARQVARLLLAAENLGIADWCVATAVEYAKTREQFGVKIGTFQAVKHLCAEMFFATEVARALLVSAVDLCRGEVSGPARTALNAAAVACAEAAAQATQGAVQVLGGIGFTWEHDAHLYFRRARANAVLTGSTATVKDALAELLIAGKGIAEPVRATSDDVAAIAERARGFFATHGHARGRDADEAAHVAAARAFRAALADAGLAGVTVPKEYGGQGLSIAHDTAVALAARGMHTFEDVCGIGIGMCVPVLLTLGTEEQKQAYIGPLLRGEQIWCQLFSEPGAGSDVASLRTKAVRDGSGPDADWVLSGQKVWTTYAHHADYGLVLARTDPDAPKHKGITMFVLDMKAPGITARPLRQMTGDAEFNEIFLDEVRVPNSAIVGELNGGWTAALVMLMNERVQIGRDPLSMSPPVNFAMLRELIVERGLGEDATARTQLAEVFVLERGLQLLGHKVAASLKPGQDPGPFASISKMGAAHLARFTTQAAFDLGGNAAAAWSGDDPKAGVWSYSMLAAPALGIAGGTDQIQRSIVAERVLGLPKG
ncbi:acyl-CoA dehydrogenase [Sporichthya polymorpha]|uniref:acyl-CoA dehydrogenase n=1 Tax=Sporichthya polymorpha TaxID=35751 RepID=UPI00037FF05E|nr:acyl-CoA dehydrogenase [Sporichthya polymorpha]